MSIADQVAQLEEDLSDTEAELNKVKDERDELDEKLYQSEEEVKELAKFKDWVDNTYPDIACQYGCVVDAGY
jgi:uncharacterized coiled-coil DUF342 family protein